MQSKPNSYGQIAARNFIFKTWIARNLSRYAKESPASYTFLWCMYTVCQVRKMYSLKNFRSEKCTVWKCLVWKMSGLKNVRSENVWFEKCPVWKMSGLKMSGLKMSSLKNAQSELVPCQKKRKADPSDLIWIQIFNIEISRIEPSRPKTVINL